MRTSRISRETTRITNALSPPSRRSTRSSLNSFKIANDAIKPEIEDGTEQAASPLRNGGSRSTSTSSLGKRKRAALDSKGLSNNALTASTPTRRSPRKAPKSADLGVEGEDEDDLTDRLKDEATSKDSSDSKPPAKPRRQPAKHIKGPNGDIVSTTPPTNWETLYTKTAAMRKRILAPVDTMGCEALAESHRSPRDQRLQTLVSLMLSSQTKDTVTAAAIANLQQNLPGGHFNLDALLTVTPERLNELICKVGFHNNKTKFIKSVAEILRDKFDGDIPDTIEGLVSLPGVGPKMAYLCMSAAWGRDEGIGVDVHVHRITNLWGWHKTSTPEQTRAELESWLPRDKWHEINHLLVGLGQTVCLPVGRRCEECDLSVGRLCPSVVKGSPVKRRVKKEVKVDEATGEVVKEEKIKIEVDDVGVKVEADVDGENRVDMKMAGSPIGGG